MDTNSFQKVLARAQGLMLDESFNAKVDGIANSFANRKGGNAGGGDLKMYEKMAFGDSSDSEKQITLLESNQGNSINVKNFDKLPDAIRESFTKMPPMSGDGNDNTPLGTVTKSLVENVVKSAPQQQYVPQGTGGGIDYSLIKSLIDESVARNLKEILGNRLNESVEPQMKGMAIHNGNKLHFVDTKGNLYEAVLKLKKKANQA